MRFDRETLNKLYRYGLSLTQDNDAAYDLLQNSIEKFLKKDRVADNPAAYLRKMMRNQFIDDCRRAKIIAFESLTEDAVPDLSTAPLEQTMIDANQIEHIFHCLMQASVSHFFCGQYKATPYQKLQQRRKSLEGRFYRVCIELEKRR